MKRKDKKTAPSGYPAEIMTDPKTPLRLVFKNLMGNRID